ncbi:hypothetical protein ACLGIH_04100 [Streptomyces sp. HMX87]|uniref:hypothetical protein n=1 Tax=Streptomyces sp. HMX87 TaxID=3390849 RepID=UPI003A8775EE
MRAIPVASVALLGACALTACVPANAIGGDVTPFGFSVQPSTVAPGGEVTLRVERSDGGCKGPATVSSPVFDRVTIPPKDTSAKAVVDWDAARGKVYQVSFTCDGATGTTSLTIADGRPSPSPTPEPVDPTHPRHPDRPDHHQHPQKGVHAGEGGTLAGFDLGEVGLGAALIVGSIGAAYHFSRRRSGEEGA